MGFFNELITKMDCSNCNKSYEFRIQFKYGATRQLEYRLGDKIIWGYNEVGEPNASNVKVYGISSKQECPFCHHMEQNEQFNEFDIYLKDDVITHFDTMQDLKDYFSGEGTHKLLSE